MSEVMRWKLKGFIPGVEGVSKALFQPWVVPAEDFDRVTGELASTSADKEAYGQNAIDLRKRVDALQQRLTAADERADVLEGLLANAYETAAKWVEKRSDDYVNEHGSNDPETGSIELPGTGEEYVCELLDIADGLRALKPAEAARCRTVSPEDRALLEAGDYTPEELFGVGGKPSCPMCFKP